MAWKGVEEVSVGNDIDADSEVLRIFRSSRRSERYQIEKKIAAGELSLDALGYSPCYLFCERCSLDRPVEDAVIRDFEMSELMEAYMRLPSREKEVIKSLYFDDLSVTDAAERIGCKRDTVRSREKKAIGRMKMLIGGDY